MTARDSHPSSPSLRRAGTGQRQSFSNLFPSSPQHSIYEFSDDDSPLCRPLIGEKSIKLPPRGKPLTLEEEPIEDPFLSSDEDALSAEPSPRLRSPRNSSRKRPRSELPPNRPTHGAKTIKLPPRPRVSTSLEHPIENSPPSSPKERLAAGPPSHSPHGRSSIKRPSKGGKSMALPTRPEAGKHLQELIANRVDSSPRDTFTTGTTSSAHLVSPQNELSRNESPFKRPSLGAKSMAMPTRPEALRRMRELSSNPIAFSQKESLPASPSPSLPPQSPQAMSKELPRIELPIKRPTRGAKSIALPARLKPPRVLEVPSEDPALPSPKDRLIAGASSNPQLRSPQDHNTSPSKRPSHGAKSMGLPARTKALSFSEEPAVSPLHSSVKNTSMAGTSSNPRLQTPELPSRPKAVRFSEEPRGQGLPSPKGNASSNTEEDFLPKKSTPTEISEIQPAGLQTPTRPEHTTRSVDEPIYAASPIRKEEIEAGSSIAPRHLTKKQTLPSNKNPYFVRDYFGQSRLHFIGSFRARYESMIGDVAKKLKVSPASLLYPSPQPPVAHRVPGVRTIVHIDMDCFFASVAMASNEALKGKPIAVCHGRSSGNGSGEISSCSYEAREFGVKAGMFFNQAKKLCPDLIGVPYDFPKYEAASFAMYIRFFSLSGVCVEALSVDEAYLDLTNSPDPNIEAVVRKLRADILEDTGCNTSAGIGPNKLSARLATSHAKPNGQYQMSQAGFDEFLKDLPIGKIPGIGRKTRRKFERMGVETAGDLRTVSLSSLQEEHGERQGKIFYNIARGIDDSPVEPMKPRKSIGAEISWGVRFANGQSEAAKCTDFLRDMAAEVCLRLLTAGAIGKKLIYKAYESKNIDGPMKYLGHGPCNIYTKSFWMDKKVTRENLLEVLETAVIQMHKQVKVLHTNLRGVGIQMTELEFEKLPGRGQKGQTAKIKSYFPQNDTKRTLFDAIPLNLDPPVSELKKREAQKINFFEVKKKNGPKGLPSEYDEDTFRELPLFIQKEILASLRSQPNGTLTLERYGADGRARAAAAKKPKPKMKKQKQLFFKTKAR